MNSTLPRRDLQRYAQCWGLSLLLHTLAIGSALIFLGDLTLATQPEPFRWEVSLVRETQPTPAEQPAPSRLPARTVQPAERKIAQQEVRQDVSDLKPVMQEIPEPMPADVQTVQSVDTSPEKPTELVQTAEAYPVPSEPTESVIQAITAAFHPAPPEMPATVDSQVAPEPPVLAAVPPAPVQEQTVSKESEAPEAVPSIQEATIRDVRPVTAVKADYGWLAKALWERVTVLKRYPYAARSKRLEGRVMLRAVIKEGGDLMDLQVVESSGHAVLDLDALDVLRRASPLKLKQPLGQSSVVVQVPISYQLQR